MDKLALWQTDLGFDHARGQRKISREEEKSQKWRTAMASL
jgi:hypothetical protein